MDCGSRSHMRVELAAAMCPPAIHINAHVQVRPAPSCLSCSCSWCLCLQTCAFSTPTKPTSQALSSDEVHGLSAARHEVALPASGASYG